MQCGGTPDCLRDRPYLDALTLRTFGSRIEEAQRYEVGALSASRHGPSALAAGAHRATTVDE